MKISTAVLSLTHKDLVVKIENIFKESLADAKVSIGMHKVESQQNSIYFLVDTEKNMTLYDIAALSIKIEKAIAAEVIEENENENEKEEREDSICIRIKNTFRSDFFETTFSDVTLFSGDSFQLVGNFLKKNYTQCFENKQEGFQEPIRRKRKEENNSLGSLLKKNSFLTEKKPQENVQINTDNAKTLKLANDILKEKKADFNDMSENEKMEFLKIFSQELGIKLEFSVPVLSHQILK